MILRTQETDRSRLSCPGNLFTVIHINRLPVPFIGNRIKLHELHDILTHRIVKLFLVYIPQKMEYHTGQQKRSYSSSIGFGHVPDLEHGLQDKHHRLELRVNLFHSFHMFNLFQSILLVDRDIKRHLCLDVQKLDQWYFRVTNVVNVTEESTFMFFDDLVDCIVYFALLVLTLNFKQDCDINIAVWQVELCSKGAEVLYLCLRVFL